MKLNFNFREYNQGFNLKFGEVNNISDGGYERGYAEGESIGYEKGHTVGQSEGYEKGYDVGFTDGENSVENYLPYCTVARFPDLNLFGKADVTINMPLLLNCGEMFRNNAPYGKPLNRTVEHITINAEQGQPTNTSMMFYMAEPWDSDNPLKHITLNMDTSKVAYAENMFGGLVKLTTVDGTPLDFSSIGASSTVRYGYSCANLAHIRFAPGTIKCNLNAADSRAYTAESIQSIIDGLADLTGQTAKKVTFHTDVLLKLTDEQVNTIGAKNWTF